MIRNRLPAPQEYVVYLICIRVVCIAAAAAAAAAASVLTRPPPVYNDDGTEILYLAFRALRLLTNKLLGMIGSRLVYMRTLLHTGMWARPWYGVELGGSGA